MDELWRRDATGSDAARRAVDDPMEVVFLAGRLGLDDDGWPLVPLIDRLGSRGIMPRRRLPGSRADPGQAIRRFVEFPALDNRWLRPSPTAAPLRGRLRKSTPAPRLHDEMAEAALALAEPGESPYVQTVDDFAVLERGVRISRRWFRGLVATSPELADESSRGWASPPTGSA